MSRQALYGAEGEAFPVKVGEIWSCGMHTFVCGDLLDPNSRIWPELDASPTLVYCDPPWDQTRADGFFKKAEVDLDYRWLSLYEKVLAFGVVYPTYVECGSKRRIEIEPLNKGIERGAWPIVYDRDTPAWLLYSGPVPPLYDHSPASPPNDMDTPGLVMRSYPRGLVFDPMAGRGLTAKHAQGQGWASLNNELNPRRISAALARLSRTYRLTVDGPC